MGRYEEAEPEARLLAESAETANDPLPRNLASRVFGEVFMETGRYTEAEGQFRRALAAAESLCEPERICDDIISIGEALRGQGRYEEAEKQFRFAAEKVEAIGDFTIRSRAFRALGNILRLQARYVEAERQLRRAVTEAEYSQNARTRCTAFGFLGDLLLGLGRFADAEQQLQRANLEGEKIRSRVDIDRCSTLISLGQVLQALRRYVEAERVLLRATEEAAMLHDPLTRCNALRALGQVLMKLSRPSDAELVLRKAVQEAERLAQPFTRSNALLSLADVLIVLHRNSEADTVLRQAMQEAEGLNEPVTLCNVNKSLGLLASLIGHWDESSDFLTVARGHLFVALSRNRRPEGVANLMELYGPIFRYGLRATEETWNLTQAPELLWAGLQFADSAKCVSIRESLHRSMGALGRQAVSFFPWHSGPPHWQELFFVEAADTKSEATRVHAAIRGLRVSTNERPVDSVFEYPGDIDENKNHFCQAIDKAGVDRLLPDASTVLVVFFFDGDQLLVLPIRRDEHRQPQILHIAQGYFRVPDCRKRVESLLQRQEKHVEDAELDATTIYEELYQVLEMKHLLELIEPDLRRLAQLHFVIIPDGPLYRLALHAAISIRGGPRLYEQVASLRYGLSLRTLELQQDVEDRLAKEEAMDKKVRGVLFADPDSAGRIGRLPSVVTEVEFLVHEVGAESWWIHGEKGSQDQRATRANLRQRHQTGNLGWMICHGLDAKAASHLGMKDELATADGRRVSVQEPFMLLCDGVLSMSRMMAEGYELSHWRLLMISACLLGSLEELGESKELLGYTATLTLLGCRRMVAALWPLADESAAQFARDWIRAIRKHVFGEKAPGPHSFAIALKEALDNLRHAEDSVFDHELFWAPYTLYGLG